MPIYEYKCKNCGAQIEKMQKVSDAPLVVCENCGGELEKQWSLSGFQFKGAGWYVTDYSSKLKDSGAGGAKDKKVEKSAADEKTEKVSGESTTKTKSASNKSNDTTSDSKTSAAAKKD